MSNGLIFDVLAVPEANAKLCRTHFGLDLHQRNWGGQIAHAHQIVGRAGEGEDPIHFAHATMANFPHQGIIRTYISAPIIKENGSQATCGWRIARALAIARPT